MAQFDLSKYDQVKDRLPKFYEKYPSGRVLTELMSPIVDLSTVVFKASLYNGEILIATGWAFEREGDGYINKTSHLENCETSAVGRALANLTLHGSNRPSMEEMEKVERMTQQPKQETNGYTEKVEKIMSELKPILLDLAIDKTPFQQALRATWPGVPVSKIIVDNYEQIKRGLSSPMLQEAMRVGKVIPF